MMNFTFFDYQNLSKDEKALNNLLHTEENTELKMPSSTSVTNILAYSKALSVRKSETIGFLEHVLN